MIIKNLNITSPPNNPCYLYIENDKQITLVQNPLYATTFNSEEEASRVAKSMLPFGYNEIELVYDIQKESKQFMENLEKGLPVHIIKLSEYSRPYNNDSLNDIIDFWWEYNANGISNEEHISEFYTQSWPYITDASKYIHSLSKEEKESGKWIYGAGLYFRKHLYDDFYKEISLLLNKVNDTLKNYKDYIKFDIVTGNIDGSWCSPKLLYKTDDNCMVLSYDPNKNNYSEYKGNLKQCHDYCYNRFIYPSYS